MDDRTELSLLISRLGRWLDEKAPDEGRALFTEDAEAHTLGGVARGVDDLVRQARKHHTVPTQHFITDPLVDVDGDRATVGANLFVVFVHEEGPRLLGERYELQAVRRQGRWRIARVQTHLIWDVANASG